MLTKPQIASEVMLHLVNHSAHGYSQPARKGDGSVETLTLSDGSKVKIHGGDYDCSESVRMCYEAAGVLSEGSYMSTRTQDALLTSHDFEKFEFESVKNNLKVGDVLWKYGHTEMYVGNGNQAGFNGDERGGLGSGARVGDQTGYESYIKPVRSYWTYVYRYKHQYNEGWIKSSKADKWWYRYSDGSYPKNSWKKIKNEWYFFDTQGWMVTGWHKWEDNWYYLNPSGEMCKSTCKKINNKWYAFEDSGAMKKDKIELRSGGSLIL